MGVSRQIHVSSHGIDFGASYIIDTHKQPVASQGLGTTGQVSVGNLFSLICTFRPSNDVCELNIVLLLLETFV